jgi:hypothetical protein
VEPKSPSRGGLARGAKLAFVAPAVIAALRSGVAFADSPAHSPSDADSSPHSPAHVSPAHVSPAHAANTNNVNAANLQGLRNLLRVGLCPNSGTTGSGSVQVLGTNNTASAVLVSLQQVRPDSTLALIFTPAGSGDVNLGQFTTSSATGNQSTVNFSQLINPANGLPGNVTDVQNGTFKVTGPNGTFNECGNDHHHG